MQGTLQHAPTCTAAERRADHLVHKVGLGAAALGVPTLLAFALMWHGLSAVTVSALIYSASLLAMLGFSAAYNMSDRHDPEGWLRRGDHAAIFAKIAGTYTPLTILHGGAMTPTILALLWTAAGLGMALKILLPGKADRLAVLLYLAMGWSVVFFGTEVLSGLTDSGFTLTVTGGLLYTVGVVFYLWESLPYQTAIWHALVLTATTLLFAVILLELAAFGPI